jgi:N-formylglutamate amidohydrolase
MAEEAMKNHAAFSWLVVDLVRGDYKQSEYAQADGELVEV